MGAALKMGKPGGGQDEGKIELGLGACWAAGAVQEELSIGSEAWVTATESQSQTWGSSQLLTNSRG